VHSSLSKPVYLCICLSVSFSFYLSVHPSLCPFLYLYSVFCITVSLCAFVTLFLSLFLSLCFSVYPSLCLFICHCLFFVSFILSISSSSSQFPSPDMCTPQAHHTFSQYLHYRHYIGRISLCQSDNPKPLCFWSLILLHKVGINKSMFS
jgi:hypothetical protein